MKSTFGDLWILYQHGSGNSEVTNSYSLTTLEGGPFPQEVVARPLAGAPAPASKTACNYRDFDQITVTLSSGPKVLAGHIMTTDFNLTDPVQDPAALTVKTNYVNALVAIGAAEVSDPADDDHAVMTQKTPNESELWYLVSHTSGNDESTGSYELTTVQMGGSPPKGCTIEAYGVNFDFDRSTLRSDSAPVLRQVLGSFSRPNVCRRGGRPHRQRRRVVIQLTAVERPRRGGSRLAGLPWRRRRTPHSAGLR
jgi:hypothetical protein